LNRLVRYLKGSIPQQTAASAGVIALLLLVMALLRLAFLVVNWPVFKRFGSAELAYSFINGARFDLRVILLLYVPFFLAVHFPVRWKKEFLLAHWILFAPVVLFLPVLALSILNMHYYAEAGRHISYEIMAVGGDRYDLLASLKMIGAYRWSILLFIVLSVILLLCGKMLLGRSLNAGNKTDFRSRIVWMLVFLCFAGLGLRGTVKGRPLRMHHAFVQGSTELGHLTLNPVFTVMESLVENEGRVASFYKEEEALKTVRALLGSDGTVWHGVEAPLYRHTLYPPRESPMPYNIVILVLESWSPRYIGAYGSPFGLTPEFDRLTASGVIYDNFYAVGSRTDEGLAALCLGIPAFNHTRSSGKGALLSGSLEQNRYKGLGSLLSNHGYSTIYLHGESSGAFRQASIARLAGFNKHLGSDELGLTREETTGPWGGWDHVLLDKLAGVLRAEPEPFLALWISLTNHSPYTLPDETFRSAAPSDTEGKYMDSVRYTDHYLGVFFRKMRQEKFFPRTIFVITADHSARTIDTMRDRFRIPFLIYAPGIVTPRVESSVGSQVDLIPTILQLLRLEGDHHAMGTSLLDGGARRFAFLNFSHGYGWVSGDKLLEIGPEGEVVGLRDMGSGGDLHEDPGPYREKALSYLQVGRQCLMENRFAPGP